MPPSNGVAASANWPEYGMIRPILMAPWVWPAAGNKLAASTPMPANRIRFIASSHFIGWFENAAVNRQRKAPLTSLSAAFCPFSSACSHRPEPVSVRTGGGRGQGDQAYHQDRARPVASMTACPYRKLKAADDRLR